jgi:hypothetical protein
MRGLRSRSYSDNVDGGHISTITGIGATAGELPQNPGSVHTCPHMSRPKKKLKNKQFLSPAHMPALRRARSSSRRKGSGPSTAAGLPRRRTMPGVFAARTDAPAPEFAASAAAVDRAPSNLGEDG